MKLQEKLWIYQLILKNRFESGKDQIDPQGIIEEIQSADDTITWKHPDGRPGRPLQWGTLTKTIDRIRKKRKEKD